MRTHKTVDGRGATGQANDQGRDERGFDSRGTHHLSSLIPHDYVPGPDGACTALLRHDKVSRAYFRCCREERLHQKSQELSAADKNGLDTTKSGGKMEPVE